MTQIELIGSRKKLQEGCKLYKTCVTNWRPAGSDRPRRKMFSNMLDMNATNFKAVHECVDKLADDHDVA